MTDEELEGLPDAAQTIEFDESDYYTGPDLTDEMIAEAEDRLGVRLPASYLDLLRAERRGTNPTLLSDLVPDVVG